MNPFPIPCLCRISAPAFAVAAALIAPVCVARAQSPAAQTDVSMANPDVQILVMPLPTGYAVSSVYPKQVTKAAAQGRIDKLLALTKWTATKRRFSDATAASNLLQDGKGGLLSAASFETTDAPFGTDGTINTEPFLQAFGDLRRVNLVFFTGDGFVYRGATRFGSERLAFSATAGQGTVMMAANIKVPAKNAAPFGLPRLASETRAEPAPQSVVRERNGEANRWLGLLFVGIAAVGFGVVIYALTIRFVQKP